jgi:hypothetical protein
MDKIKEVGQVENINGVGGDIKIEILFNHPFSDLFQPSGQFLLIRRYGPAC